MDIIEMFSHNIGTFTIGTMWGLYIIWDRLWSDKAKREKTAEDNKAEGGFQVQMVKALTDANTAIAVERNRYNGIAEDYARLNGQVGHLRASLESAQRDRDIAIKDSIALRDTVEQLVIENRNKDRANTQLIDLNRKLLRSMGTPPVEEPAPMKADKRKPKITQVADVPTLPYEENDG